MNELDGTTGINEPSTRLRAIRTSAGATGADSSTLLRLAPLPIYESVPPPCEEDVLALIYCLLELRNLDAMNVEN